MKHDYTTVLQLTDLHLFADPAGLFNNVNTRDCFIKTIIHVQQHYEQPDLIIITGDLAHDGSTEAYHFIAEALKIFSVPVYYVLGNHDHPENAYQVYPLEFVSTDKYHSLKHWQIIFVDSNDQPIQDSYEGEVSQAELQRIKALIESYPDKWTIIAMHHNLPAHYDRGIDYEIRNHQQVIQWFEQLPSIKLVVSGHVHQEFVIIQQGICYLSTPSTGYQSLSKSKCITNDVPGYRWLKLYNNGRFETDVRRINVWAS
ncbi:MAG: hypothetical protein RIT35_259 [Pseudomonadota bacterium]|jgi:Icc protein